MTFDNIRTALASVDRVLPGDELKLDAMRELIMSRGFDSDELPEFFGGLASPVSTSLDLILLLSADLYRDEKPDGGWCDAEYRAVVVCTMRDMLAVAISLPDLFPTILDEAPAHAN